MEEEPAWERLSVAEVVADAIDMAEVGRVNGVSGVGETQVREEGCWRTAKTKVLFTAKRTHCGCDT